MLDLTVTFSSNVWCYVSKATWYFATLPKHEAERIKALQGKQVGFGSVPVHARIGETEWKTSIFPSKQQATYILPLKAEIRKKESIYENSVTEITLLVKGAF